MVSKGSTRPFFTNQPGQTSRASEVSETREGVLMEGRLDTRDDHRGFRHIRAKSTTAWSFRDYVRGKITRTPVADDEIWGVGGRDACRRLLTLHLSAFTSITRLYLFSVTLPTIMTFRRLVCALPNLNDLQCTHIEFRRRHFEAGLFLQRPRRLTTRRVGILSPCAISSMLLLPQLWLPLSITSP